MQICHTCDITCCVNPEHLFPGNGHKNMMDCISKGRQSCVKFTDDQIRQIRAEYAAIPMGGTKKKRGETATLAKKYGCTVRTILAIVTGERYKWVK